MSETKDGIEKILIGCWEILGDGGRKERKKLKKVVRAMDWFKNFGESYCRELERLEEELEVKPEDTLKWE